jgi:hypothetical protein
MFNQKFGTFKIVGADGKDARGLQEGDLVKIVKITPTAIWAEKLEHNPLNKPGGNRGSLVRIEVVVMAN